MDRRLLPMLLAWSLAAPALAEQRETPRTAKLEGVSLGMLSSELRTALVSRGFMEHAERRREFREEAGGVRKRVRYREIQGARGPTVHEIDHSIWYPPGGFDLKQVLDEVRGRFGEPASLHEQAGRVEIRYLEDPGAPAYGQVAEACRAEIQRRDPELPEAQAKARAGQASLYRSSSEEIERVCPGTLDLYRRFGAGVGGPRMTVVIWPAMARVDTRLTWTALAD